MVKKMRKDITENFLSDILNVHVEQNKMLDNKASFYLGISGVAFALSLTHIISGQFVPQTSGILIIAISTLISSFLCIWVIRFPLIRDKPHIPHLMYYKAFEKLSVKEYSRRLLETLKDDKKIVDQYAKQIFDLVEQSIKRKYLLIRIISLVLTLGLLIGSIITFYYSLLAYF